MKDKSTLILYGVAIVIVIVTITCVIINKEKKKEPYKNIGEGFTQYYENKKQSDSYLNEITNQIVNNTNKRTE